MSSVTVKTAGETATVDYGVSEPYRPVSFPSLAAARASLATPADAEYVMWPGGTTKMLEEVFASMKDNQILVLPERPEPYYVDSADGFRTAGVKWITGSGGKQIPIVNTYRGVVARTWFGMARARRGILGLGPGAVIQPSPSSFKQEAQIYPGAIADTGWEMVGCSQKIIETVVPNSYFGNFTMKGQDFGAVAYHAITAKVNTTFENIHFIGAHKGFKGAPNGESGSISVNGKYLIRNCEIDCRDPLTKLRKGASPIMINSSAGGTMENVYAHEAYAGMLTIWNSSGKHSFKNVRAEFNRAGVNLESSLAGFEFEWIGGTNIIDYKHTGEHPEMLDTNLGGNTGLHLSVKSPNGSQKITVRGVKFDKGPLPGSLSVQIFGAPPQLQVASDIQCFDAKGAPVPVKIYN